MHKPLNISSMNSHSLSPVSNSTKSDSCRYATVSSSRRMDVHHSLQHDQRWLGHVRRSRWSGWRVHRQHTHRYYVQCVQERKWTVSFRIILSLVLFVLLLVWRCSCVGAGGIIALVFIALFFALFYLFLFALFDNFAYTPQNSARHWRQESEREWLREEAWELSCSSCSVPTPSLSGSVPSWLLMVLKTRQVSNIFLSPLLFIPPITSFFCPLPPPPPPLNDWNSVANDNKFFLLPYLFFSQGIIFYFPFPSSLPFLFQLERHGQEEM